jgi:hypothetical protein
MIARCVHHHTPQAQLERPEFKVYATPKSNIPQNETVVNIDAIPNFSAETNQTNQSV